jgi:hypothetical protein
MLMLAPQEVQPALTPCLLKECTHAVRTQDGHIEGSESHDGQEKDYSIAILFSFTKALTVS